MYWCCSQPLRHHNCGGMRFLHGKQVNIFHVERNGRYGVGPTL